MRKNEKLLKIVSIQKPFERLGPEAKNVTALIVIVSLVRAITLGPAAWKRHLAELPRK